MKVYLVFADTNDGEGGIFCDAFETRELADEYIANMADDYAREHADVVPCDVKK